jgi:glycosyltransferase involved in cell wall biosynthesis
MRADMNVLFVHESAGVSGGAETNIQITAEELKRRGHTVGLLCIQPPECKKFSWEKYFSKVFYLNPEPTPASAEVLQTFKPDLLYIHKIKQLDFFEALLATSLPTVRMVHDHEMYCLRQYKYNPLTRAICTRSASGFCVFPCLAPLARNRGARFPVKWASYADRHREMDLSKKCDRLIVYSDYSKGELVRNGFDPAKIHMHVPIRCWGNDGPVASFNERNLVLFAGQIIRGKGVDLLLRALSRVTIPFECILLGEGSHRSYCEKLSARLGLTDRVKFVGYVPHEQMRGYYLDANVFAMPSVWPEPFGMAGPEAMRYGLPVVAFDAGGIREWLKDGVNGCLVPWMDTQSFATRLEQLLGDKRRAAEMGRNGLEHVNSSYSAATQVDRLENLFISLVNEGQFSLRQRTSPTAPEGNAAESFIVSKRVGQNLQPDSATVNAL